MSIRAYKLIKMVWEKAPTFNISNDSEVVELLDICDKMYDGGGTVYILEEDVREAIGKATRDDTKKILYKILDQMEDGYVEYTCF